MRDRPLRSKKSTKLNDFWYPTRKKRKKTIINEKIVNEGGRRNRENQQEARSPSPEVRPESPSPRAPPSPTQERAQEAISKNLEEIPQPEKTSKELLEELYRNPKFPTFYGGQIQKYLRENVSLSRHKRRVYKFKRRKVLSVL